MYTEPKQYSIGDKGEVSSTYGLRISTHEGKTLVAGIDTVNAVTLPYIPNQIQTTYHKPEKPFIVIDGVVYINAKLIKENTL